MTAPDNQPMLPTCAMTPAGVPGVWCVACVSPRHEKKLAFALMGAGFGFFLPLVKRVYIHKANRNRIVRTVPIFPDYVFAAALPEPGDTAKIPAALNGFLRSQRGAHTIIPVLDIDQHRLRRELSMLHAAVVANPNMGGEAFKPGVKARVVSGPWLGQEGAICAVTGRGTVRLPITTLGRVVEVEIDAAELEPI